MIHVTLIIMSRKYFFDFRSPDLPFDIYDFGLDVSTPPPPPPPPSNAISEGRRTLQHELGSGSS